MMTTIDMKFARLRAREPCYSNVEHRGSGGCMKSLALRLTLLVLFVAAAGAAAYSSWSGRDRERQDGAAVTAWQTSAVSAERDILELRSAQQGYVAAGQGDPFWAAKVDASIAKVRDGL